MTFAYIGYGLLTPATIWMVVVLFRRREKMATNSVDEMLSTIGVCLALAFFAVGAVYITLHLIAYILVPEKAPYLW